MRHSTALFLLGLVFSGLVPAQRALAETAVVTVDEAKVYIGQKVITTLTKGQQVTVTGRNGKWLGVAVKTAEGEKKGWLYGENVELLPEGAPPPDDLPPIEAEKRIEEKETPESTPRPVAGEAPQELIQKLKSAAVFIEVRAMYGRKGTGSGFLFRRSGETGYVVTTAYWLRRLGSQGRKVTLVFNSGEPNERTVEGEIVGEDDTLGIAILRGNATDLPEPISLKEAKLRQTMPVYVAGFPFGKMLAEGREHPAITIARATVSSIRKERDGSVAAIQLEGDINPGSSGAPVVDGTAALVGVAVLRVAGTQTCFAIPPANVKALLVGRVERVHLATYEVKGGTCKIHIGGAATDPLRRIRELSVLYVSRRKVGVPPRPRRDGTWGRIASGMREAKLSVKGMDITGHITIRRSGATQDHYYYQVRIVRSGSKPLYTAPRQHYIDFGRTFASRRPTTGSGISEPSAKLKKVKIERPVASNRGLGGKTQTVNDATLTVVDLGRAQIEPCMHWSGDAKFVYAIEYPSTIRRIAVPDFRETHYCDLKQACKSMVRCSEGLLLLMSTLDEAWLLDEASLSVKKRFPFALRSLHGIAASVNLPNALAAGSSELVLFSLKTGKQLKTWTGHEIWTEQSDSARKYPNVRRLSSFREPRLSPDGRYLFCHDYGSLHRFRLEEQRLIYEEVGPPIASLTSVGIVVSADSSYVALVLANRSGSVPDHPSLSVGGAFMYRVTDLQKPVITAECGPHPSGFAFDKVARRLYFSDFRNLLITYDAAGTREKEYAYQHWSSKQILVHPDGHKMLLLTRRNKLVWLELPGAVAD